MARCPGQDQRYWTADDIFDLRCPYCGYEIEFWKDEPFRMCRGCEREIRNPRINLGCAEWCQNSDACLGRSADGQAASPLVERVAAALEQVVDDPEKDLGRARCLCSQVDANLGRGDIDPLVAKCLALIVGASFEYDGARLTFDGDWREFLRHLLEIAELEDAEISNVIKPLKELIIGRPVMPESQLIQALLSL